MTGDRLTLMLAQARALREERDRTTPHASLAPELRLLTDLGHEVAALVTRTQQATTWQPMDKAPRNGTEILVQCERANTIGFLVVHWAHGGGEDQPVFGPGWFFYTGNGFLEKTVGELKCWLPIPAPPPA